MKKAQTITEKYKPVETKKEVAVSSGYVVREIDYHFKIHLVGDGGAGKNGLLRRFVDNNFSDSSVGFSFQTRRIEAYGKNVALQVINLAGEERFRQIKPELELKGGHACILVFDLADQVTFDNLTQYIMQIQQEMPSSVKLFLVGAKKDQTQRRVVDYEKAAEFAKTYNMPYIETSAKTGENVEAVFLELTQILVESKTPTHSVSKQGLFNDKNTSAKESETPKKDRGGCAIS